MCSITEQAMFLQHWGPSTALAAPSGVLALYLHALYLLSTVPMGISISIYCT